MTTSENSHPTIIGTFRTMSGPVQVLLWGTFLSNLLAFMNAFLVLFLIDQKHFSAYWAGVALTVLLLSRIPGTAFGGFLADRVGYRWTTVISMFGSSIGVAGVVFVSEPWMAIALAAFIGVVAQAYRPASQAWVMELVPQDRHVMLFSIYRLAFNIGTTVGPLIAAVLVLYSYNLLFFADALATLLFGILALLVLPNDRPARKETAAAAAEPGSSRRSGYGAVLRDTRFMLVVFGLFLTAIVYIQGTAALPVYINGSGYGKQIYPFLLTLNGAMVIALEVVLTKFTQRLAIQIPIVLGMLLLGVGHLLYLLPVGVAAVFIGTFVWTLGEIVAAPSMMAYPGRVAKPGLRARYVAASTVPQQAGYAIGPLVGLAAWQLWGSGVWILTGSIGLLAALVTLIGARWVPRHPEPAAPEPTDTDVEPVSGEPVGTAPIAPAPVAGEPTADPVPPLGGEVRTPARASGSGASSSDVN